MTPSTALDLAASKAPRTRETRVERTRAGGLGWTLAPIVAGVGVVVLIGLALSLARSEGTVAALWGASGLATAVWLRQGGGGRSLDAAFFAAMATALLVGELLAGNPPALSVFFTIVNLIEIAGAVAMARRFAPALSMNTLEDAARLLVSTAVLPPLAAGLVASLGLGLFTGAPILPNLQTWWLGHAMGMAVICSTVVAATPVSLRVLARPQRALEAAGLLVGLVALCLFAFTGGLPLGFLLLPALVLIALRFRVLGVAAAICVIALVAVGASLIGHGPYRAAGDLSQQVMTAQLLVVVGYMPFTLLASLIEERAELVAAARRAQRQAEIASAAKSRLLANVAHEIKSPVAGVIGIGELWSKGQLGLVTPQQVEMADMLVRTAREVEHLAHDLLDVARAEAGAVRVDLRPTDMFGVMQDVRRALILRPEAQDVAVEVQGEPSTAVALADSQRMAQVLTNLGVNAMKYGRSGGRVVLRAVREDAAVRIEVIDFGPGLSSEKQAQLFEPFNRLGLERSTIEGHGIGLALARRLVELQSGQIGVVSEPGEGATFWVTLPGA